MSRITSAEKLALDTRRYDEAIAHLEKAIPLFKEIGHNARYPPIYIAEAHLGAGRPAAALSTPDREVNRRNFGQSARYWHLRADALGRLGRSEEARLARERAKVLK